MISSWLRRHCDALEPHEAGLAASLPSYQATVSMPRQLETKRDAFAVIRHGFQIRSARGSATGDAVLLDASGGLDWGAEMRFRRGPVISLGSDYSRTVPAPSPEDWC